MSIAITTGTSLYCGCAGQNAQLEGKIRGRGIRERGVRDEVETGETGEGERDEG